MLNKISFQNYKAFTSGEVKIKPITILLGANSVGKSSIMQLFLMLQQTALSESNYKSALKLHGGFVSMGEGLNLIRKKDSTKILSISIDYYNGNILEELQEEYFIRFCEEVYYFATIIKKYSAKDDAHSDSWFQKIRKLFKGEEDFDIRFMRMNPKNIVEIFDRETFVDLINNTQKRLEKLDPKEFPKEFQDDFFYYRHSPHRMRRPINHIKSFRDQPEEYILTYDFLKGIRDNLTKGHFIINYDIASVEKNLILKKIGIYNDENEILSVEFDTHPSNNYKAHSITSKFINSDIFSTKTLQSLKNIFINPRTIFGFLKDNQEFEKDEKTNSVFAGIVNQIIHIFNDITSDYFENDNINYVSPLRAHPKRYYFLDKAKINAYVDTLDGDAIAETLKENAFLRNQVNTWLEKFNLKVEVSQLQDIIHKLVVNQNSLSLDITDVGFGISQVLPVIIQGFLSHNNSLTLIEQPEIHLHPKMQADLADLFIDIVLPTKQNKKEQKALKYLFIETHSEYLLKRLRRRISDGTISPDNVAIYLIDPQTDDTGAIIRELIVKEKGQFDWPIDFYGGELLKDTTEFIKNQQNQNA